MLGRAINILAKNMKAKTPKYVIFYCKSGRHRSVMCANILRYILEAFPKPMVENFYFENWTHYCEFYWRSVRCQVEGYGNCKICSEGSWHDSEAARHILGRLGKFFCEKLTQNIPI